MKHLEQTLKPQKWSIMTHGFHLNLEGGLARYKLFSTFACVIIWLDTITCLEYTRQQGINSLKA